MIKEAIGFSILGIGILWSIFERSLCKNICETCTNQQLSPCFFLFIFVGIILIVDGASLILLENQLKKNKFKKKSKKKSID